MVKVQTSAVEAAHTGRLEGKKPVKEEKTGT